MTNPIPTYKAKQRDWYYKNLAYTGETLEETKSRLKTKRMKKGKRLRRPNAGKYEHKPRMFG